jgi:hypothetical protein
MPRGDTVIGFAVGIGAHSRPEVSRPPPLFHSGFRANGCHWAPHEAVFPLFKSTQRNAYYRTLPKTQFLFPINRVLKSVLTVDGQPYQIEVQVFVIRPIDRYWR